MYQEKSENIYNVEEHTECPEIFKKLKNIKFSLSKEREFLFLLKTLFKKVV